MKTWVLVFWIIASGDLIDIAWAIEILKAIPKTFETTPSDHEMIMVSGDTYRCCLKRSSYSLFVDGTLNFKSLPFSLWFLPVLVYVKK